MHIAYSAIHPEIGAGYHGSVKFFWMQGPAFGLEALHGDRQGQYSIRINDQWRLCFAWRDGAAWDVEVADYL
jgi:plasmid maintenance system killer protein